MICRANTFFRVPTDTVGSFGDAMRANRLQGTRELFTIFRRAYNRCFSSSVGFIRLLQCTRLSDTNYRIELDTGP